MHVFEFCSLLSQCSSSWRCQMTISASRKHTCQAHRHIKNGKEIMGAISLSLTNGSPSIFDYHYPFPFFSSTSCILRVPECSLHNQPTITTAFFQVETHSRQIENKHNAELQRTDPGANVTGEFITKDRIFPPKC